MTGFKSGVSSDDPFDSGSDEDSGPEEPKTAQPIDTDQRSDIETRQHEDVVESGSKSPNSGLPWIYKRDSITDGRSKTVQLHLQDSTLKCQRDARSDIENELNESVKKADLREAALLIGLTYIDEVADELRDWGYDFE